MYEPEVMFILAAIVVLASVSIGYFFGKGWCAKKTTFYAISNRLVFGTSGKLRVPDAITTELPHLAKDWLCGDGTGG